MLIECIELVWSEVRCVRYHGCVYVVNELVRGPLDRSPVGGWRVTTEAVQMWLECEYQDWKSR